LAGSLPKTPSYNLSRLVNSADASQQAIKGGPIFAGIDLGEGSVKVTVPTQRGAVERARPARKDLLRWYSESASALSPKYSSMAFLIGTAGRPSAQATSWPSQRESDPRWTTSRLSQGRAREHREGGHPGAGPCECEDQERRAGRHSEETLHEGARGCRSIIAAPGCGFASGSNESI
jgi:hypothetical protein